MSRSILLQITLMKNGKNQAITLEFRCTIKINMNAYFLFSHRAELMKN